MKRKMFVCMILVFALVMAFTSTAFASGSATYYGSCVDNFNTSSRISGISGQTGWDRVYSASKTSWTSRIYSSNGQCQANPNNMTPNGVVRTQLLNGNANSQCYLNVKNPSGAALTIPQYYGSVYNGTWGIS